MKNQALFSFKDKSKNLKCHLLQILFGVLRVKLNKQVDDRCEWIKVLQIRRGSQDNLGIISHLSP